jgi:hypothetical protein
MRRASARLTDVDFTGFTLSQLPPAPQRVLEVGCGHEGGVAPELARAGYDVLAIDPQAPEGPLYRRIPLGPALDKLAGLAPLLLLDEFAWNHMDDPSVEWYEGQHRLLRAAGRQPKGPPDLTEWHARHSDLHPYETLRAELDARYETKHFEWRPYFYLWLEGPASEALESALIDARAIRPIGWRYVGRTSSKRAPSASGS